MRTEGRPVVVEMWTDVGCPWCGLTMVPASLVCDVRA